ncbi:phospholipase A [Algibacillus agarilyticus]|uniref:phospholipase A n=1 Tax=Algibacillus agarilyticus TaxID=2234133 RepID=UPI0018E5532F|nr:phospholipase A [Algibacillus agarilyticus]
MKKVSATVYGLLLILNLPLQAKETDYLDCIETHLVQLANDAMIAKLKERCKHLVTQEANQPGALSRRFDKERNSAFNPYVITPHRMNYILPFTYTDSINTDAYQDLNNYADNLEKSESKFQMSLKVPFNEDPIFSKGDGLYFGFTLASWWQVYSNNISKPFRETNYRPELFYITPINWRPLSVSTGAIIGIEHQSNGRTQILSRSWNRVYAGFLVEKQNFAFAFVPWIRIPENKKADPLDDKGDDNPDIQKYMGHFEVLMAHKWDRYEVNLMTRYNFTSNNGGVELGFTFPLWGKIRGYAQYFAGYGESLIDYNHKHQRLGIGIALTNIL